MKGEANALLQQASVRGGWNSLRLGQICRIRTGKRDVNEGNPLGAYPFFTCSKEVHYSDTYSFDTEAILVAGNGAVGETKYFNGKFEAYQRTYVLDEFAIHAPYLFLYLRFTLIAELTQQVSGSTMPYIRRGDLENIEVPIPSLHEQQRIAELLGLLHRSLEQEERLIPLTAQVQRALLHHLLSRGLIGEPQRQTEIGPVPQSWEVVRIQDICSLVSGGTPSKQRADFWLGSIPWVSPKDMKKPRLFDVVDHISQEGLESGSSLAPAGAVFVVIRGMILAKDVPVALAQNPMAFNQDMKAIIPGPRIHPEYLLYALVALKQHLFQKVGRSAHGTMTLMSSELAQFRIPLPDYRTQQEIASLVTLIERKHEQHRRRHTFLSSLFRSLLHQLMTARIRFDELALSEPDATMERFA